MRRANSKHRTINTSDKTIHKPKGTRVELDKYISLQIKN